MITFVFRSPRGSVFHKLKHWSEFDGSQLPPTLACRFDIVFDSFWSQAELKTVPKAKLCCKCFPEQHNQPVATRKPNRANGVKAIAKIALEKWREYRQMANWDRGVDEDGKELKQIEKYEKELGIA